MGIYISGVKGLPEQVQENKNKIKEVEEQIEGIDFDAIRELQGQVAENTQDINNLEASIGVQNQAINTLNNDVDALESKTQKITYDEDADEIHIASDVIMEEDLEVDNVHVAGNGTFQNANGSGLHFQEGVNDDEVCLVNKESGTAHDLTLHADGTLTLDGGPVGAKPLYNHIISISVTSASATIVVQLTLEKSTALSDNEFYHIIHDNGYTTNSNYLGINKDYISLDLANGTFVKMLGLYANNNTTYARINNNGTTTSASTVLVSDQVIPAA